MTNSLKKIDNVGNVITIVLIAIPLVIVSIPFLLIFFPIAKINDKRFQKEYIEYLKKNEGKNIFCYNNRLKSKEYIENEIIPLLSNDIDIVFLNGKNIESKYDSKFISKALYSLSNYKGFPHLIKIQEGKIIDKSINNIFYNVKNGNQSEKDLFIQINQFFELK